MITYKARMRLQRRLYGIKTVCFFNSWFPEAVNLILSLAIQIIFIFSYFMGNQSCMLAGQTVIRYNSDFQKIHFPLG